MGHALLEVDKLGNTLKEKDAFYVPTLGILRFSRLEHTQDTARKNLKRLVDEGVKVALGTDSTNSRPEIRPGLTMIRELEVMADAGLSNAQIITAATRNTAEHLGLVELRTVEKGKIADLIIVDDDPLKFIAAMRNVQTVFQAGQVVVAAE